MSNHANEAVMEQIAEEVMEMTVGDFLDEINLRSHRYDREMARDVVNKLILERFFERAQ